MLYGGDLRISYSTSESLSLSHRPPEAPTVSVPSVRRLTHHPNNDYGENYAHERHLSDRSSSYPHEHHEHHQQQHHHHQQQRPL
mmetsp:Transcript_49620/g.63605  ORF Transcript_49620/g.63605 Transcript_49620/m.63605 type:complete len:84 (-) Transcript_49620:201-452(-)